MQRSLEQCRARLEELDRALMDPSILSSSEKLRNVTTERAQLEPIVNCWTELEDTKNELQETRELLSDPEFKEMAQQEIVELNARIEDLSQQLKLALIPPDPFEGRDIILEVRAGTGGDEAAIFAYDLFRMC